MTEDDDLRRAQALLARTREILATVEAEVSRLADETGAAMRRLREWEEQMLALLPPEEPVDRGTAVHGVRADDAAGTETERGTVYAVDVDEGPRVVTRE